VLNKQLHDARFDMTVHVDPSRRDIVVSRFDAEPRGARGIPSTLTRNSKGTPMRHAGSQIGLRLR
jgi:hypothetical protein